MSGALTRWKDLALRPLWSEEPAYRARRRCRMMISAPFAALGGLTWGIFAAPAIGTGSPLFWGALGAIALPLLMYVEQRVAPGLAALFRRLGFGSGAVAGAAAETALVAGIVFWLTRGVGMPTVPAVGTALGIGAFYGFVMEYVLCGEAANDAVAMIQGAGLRTPSRRALASRADSLAARGELTLAIQAFEEAIAATPRESSLYLKLSRLHRRVAEPQRAAEVLSDGLRTAKLTPDQDGFMVRERHALLIGDLDLVELAIQELADFLDRAPGSIHAEWAGAELDRLADRV